MSDPVRRVDLLGKEDLPYTVERYRLLEIIGEGGMGRVYRAELQGPSGFRKQCALKVVRLDATHADVASDAFINEARLGGLLNHPNVVATLDFGQLEGLPFIAMELVDGVTLDRLIRKADGGLPRSVVLDAAIQTCAGLDHAHDLSDDGRPAVLVHRDLKPSNIIVSRYGMAKVMDFGIAKANDRVGEHTRTGMTKGTPNYMSPEQIDGEALDRRSDIFAMGALLYIMLVGRHLFEKRTGGMLSILLAISRVEEMLEDGTRLAIVDEIVPGLGPVIRRCLRFDPANRHASARELAADLKRVRGTLPERETLAEFMDQIYGEDEPSHDRAPLYRLSTDTRDSRARAEASPPPSWNADDATSNPTQVPPPDDTFAPPPARREPSQDPIPTAVTEDPMSARKALRWLPMLLGGFVVLLMLALLLGLAVKKLVDLAPGPSAVTELTERGENSAVEPPTGHAEIVVEEPTGATTVDPGDEGATEAAGETATKDEGQPSETPTEAVVTVPLAGDDDDEVAAQASAVALALSSAALPDKVSAGFSKTFQVQLTGADEAEVAVLLRGEGQDWRLHHLRGDGDGAWSVSLPFTPEMVGRCEYYFWAQRPDDSASRVYLGDKGAPFSLQVW
jgi:eukaryotic-like serine/threonine-protein kinase